MSVQFTRQLLRQASRHACGRHLALSLRAGSRVQGTAARSCLGRTPVSSIYRFSTTVPNSSNDQRPSTTDFAITEHEYNRLADATMDDLVTYLEDLGDNMEIDEFDVEYSQGVLTLSLGSVGTYVINKQPPNRQIWISSPISGPERFDYQADRDAWICRKTSDTLGELLQRELQNALPLSSNLSIPIN